MEIFFIVGLALLGGLLLILLLALGGRKRESEVDRPKLSLQQFQNASLLLVEEMKLKIDEAEIRENGIDIMATNPQPFIGGPFLIRCLYLAPEAIVDVPQVIEFSNTVLQERVKGIFLTTGRFTPELSAIGELASIEFIDGEKFKSLIAKYHIATVP